MTMKNNLSKYLGYNFSNSPIEYKKFENLYVKYIKNICAENDWLVVKVIRGYFYCSMFIKDQANHYVYVSSNDVRFATDEWFNHVLVRSAKDDRDYTGGTNRFNKLESISETIRSIFSQVKILYG